MKLGSPFRPRLLSAFLISIFLGSAPSTLAQERGELRIATSYKLMTLDPQYANLNENTSLLSHIYERLVYQDDNLELKPGLAKSWRPLSDTQWAFKLRDKVRFHDGSVFDADDVVYTIERIRDFLKPPSGGFRSYVSGIKSVSAPDPLTVLIETDGAVPNLPLFFSSIFVMNRPA
ncbi:ABC transporter substrate-binding protein, partial [Sinorhizobium meliloti]